MTKASRAAKEKKPLKFFGLPWPVFLIITVIVLIATYLGVLPKGMAGCFVFMIVVGEILAWIGDHTPIIKSYLGGGAIVVIFGSALLVYFGLIPSHVAPGVGAPKAITAVNQAVDDVLVTRAAELKKEDKKLDVETPYDVDAVIDVKGSTHVVLADEKIVTRDDKTLVVKVDKEGKEGKTVCEVKSTVHLTLALEEVAAKDDPEKTEIRIKSLAVDPKGLSDADTALLKSEAFAANYAGAAKSSAAADPVTATVTAVNSAVDNILTNTKNADRVGKDGKDATKSATVMGYKNTPVKVTVTFGEDKGVKSIAIDSPGTPQEALDYVTNEEFTGKFAGKKGYTVLSPFANLDLVGNIGTFFKTTGGFLDWYIAALITGSILGMNRKLLIKAAARYFPAIFGGLICAFALCMGVAAIMGYPVMNALLLISLPIMGGGMGAGASPLSKIFEGSGSMSAAQALSVMTPAVAIGNAVSIVLAGVLVKVLSSDKLNGHGQLMRAGSMDPKELEISPEMQQKRDKIDIKNLGIGLLVSGTFFAIGYILQGCWDALGTGITVHAYAWMIITVAVCKVTNIVPESIEVACYQWFQFIMKNLTNVLLLGIGVCYLEIGTVISSFSLTYLLLCAATCIGAFVGAAFIGRLVGFYPFESGVTAGLCMSNMGGTGDVAVLSSADRMELMPFAQISSRLGGAIILLIASLMLSILAPFLTAI